MPMEDEFNKIGSRLKRNKAAGLDTIVNEMIEYGGDALKQTLLELMVQIWENERMPAEWESGTIILILQIKELIQKKIQYVEEKIGDYQNGFRPSILTADSIYTINQYHRS
ncbi:hypothetical protein QE152_g7731 [Popillia japonica]|uniref:Uncharacterized protein n=1 Tax=Popillia japonica TaxID=7064 RepID=A0AAW1MES6_POPJA